MKNIYLTKKKIKGRNYLYLEGRAWINGKSRRTWQKYLGSEEKFKDINLTGIFSKNESNVETETLEFGISAALFKIAQDIGLSEIISETIGKRNQGLSPGEYFTIAAINRCIDPCSKSKLKNWFQNDWLSTQYDVKPKVLNAQTFWNHFGYLSDDILEKIQLKIIKTVIQKYGIKIEGLLYDPSNFFTFSQGGRGWREGKGSDMLQFGKSKENRNDKRQVSFWLVCDRDTGIPLFHYSYPGNCQDAGIFKEIPKRTVDGSFSRNSADTESVPERVHRYLNELGIDFNNVTMVFDNGNLSEDGMQEIDKKSLKFIASRRPSTHKDLLSVPRSKFSDLVLSMTGKSVSFYKTTKKIYGQKRIVYTTLDPAKQKKKILEFRVKLDKKKAEIEHYFQDRLDPRKFLGLQGQGQKWLKRVEVESKVKKMIGRAPFKKILLFQVIGPDEVIPNKTSPLQLSLEINLDAQKQYEETLGRSVIFTNQSNWTPEEVIWGYRQQYIVEHAFRNMKDTSIIAIRPMYHHSSTTIPGHVFICMISYLLLSLLRLTLARTGCPASFEEITDSLRKIHVTKIFIGSNADLVYKIDRSSGLGSKIIKCLKLKNFI